MSDTTTQQPVAGDRGAAGDARSPAAQAASERRRQVIGASTVIVGGVLALTYFVRSPAVHKAEPKQPAKIEQKVQFDAVTNLNAMTAPQPIRPAPPVAISAPLPPPVDETLDAARRAPPIAFSAAMAPTSSAIAAPEGARANEDNGQFERRLTPSRFDVAKAGHIGDRRFIVAQGTSIPCILETAMQSDQPGFVSCVIPRDVLSDSGQIVLMEKGTQVVGEYRGGLNQGQSRLHVLWGRAKTPTGVVVQMGSAATDALGRAGVGGTIDNHWWERFGSALLLSVVSDASGAGSAALKQRIGVESQGTGQSMNQAAAMAVEQSGSIKPTLHKNQGEMVSIFVARDLDFTGVYQLQVVRSPAWSTTTSGRPLK